MEYFVKFTKIRHSFCKIKNNYVATGFVTPKIHSFSLKTIINELRA